MSSFHPLRPWRHPLRLWRAGCYNLTALPVSIVSFVVIVTLAAMAAGFVFTVVFAVPVAWLLFLVSRGLGHLERNRIAALAGVEIADPVPPLSKPTLWGRFKERFTSAARWRELGHHLAHLPVGVLGYGLTTVVWSASLALLAMPTYINALPEDEAKFGAFTITNEPPLVIAAAAVGLAGVLFIAPWMTIGAARLNLTVARLLLGPTADQDHAAEVERLESQRGAAVDSAESERRRIERDLHDGAQQRLVALAAGLGVAKEKLVADPAEGERMVAAAHDEAKAALREIRDLVRGIHPVILEDRGLDAALSAVVARSPIPVALDVRLDRRPPAAVESAAYFVVNEALTNVAKHAEATRAKVSIATTHDRLVIEVHDNGQGGADAAGGGLRGLRDRIEGLGGSLFVVSPDGGPTTISVEVPCGS